MSYYYYVRGWLEVDEGGGDKVIEAINNIKKLHQSDAKKTYFSEGWVWNKKQAAWTDYFFFYGRDVKEVGLDFFKETLEELCKLNLGITGFFHAQGEGGEYNYTYKINYDKLEITEEDDKPFLPL